MYLLGIHDGHNASAALMKDGEILDAIQEERFNKIKNFGGFPENSISYILKKNNLNIVKEIIFPDHYSYKDQDIITIKDTARNLNAKIITTEKDYVKLSEKNLGGLDFLEIELKIKDEDNFVKFFRSKINEKY